jgi:hypothetical protein
MAEHEGSPSLHPCAAAALFRSSKLRQAQDLDARSFASKFPGFICNSSETRILLKPSTGAARWRGFPSPTSSRTLHSQSSAPRSPTTPTAPAATRTLRLPTSIHTESDEPNFQRQPNDSPTAWIPDVAAGCVGSPARAAATPSWSLSMRRAALERPRTIRIWKAHLRFTHQGDPGTCSCDVQPGRFRKTQRIGGCLKPRCGLCKRHKLNDLATRQQYLADIAWNEAAAELGFTVTAPRKAE